MTIPAALLTAIAEPGAHLHVGFDMTLDRAYKFSSYWLRTATGQYDGKVKSWGAYSRSAESESGHIETPEHTLVIYDPKDVLAKSMYGAWAGKTLGSPASVTLMSERVDPDKYYTYFDGIIGRHRPAGDRMWEFVARVNDVPLQNEVQLPVVNELDFPGAVATEEIGTKIPVIYGLHSSLGITGATGNIDAPLIHNTAGIEKRIVCLGVVVAGLRVWNSTDSVKVGIDPGAGGILGYRTVAGEDINPQAIWYQLFNALDDTKDYSLEVAGLDTEDSWGGQRQHQMNPAYQIKHFIVHWIYNAWRSGDWLADSAAPIDADSFDVAAAYFKRKKLAGSLIVEAGVTGAQVMNSWAEQWGAKFFWTLSGKIAVSIEDHMDDLRISDRHIQQRDILEELGGNGASTDNVLTDITVNYPVVHVGGGTQKTMRLADSLRTVERQEVGTTFIYDKVGGGV